MKYRNTSSISISSIIKWRKLFFITILLIAFGINSCKKENDVIGLGLQPESEILNANVIDSTTLVTFPLREDSIRSDSRVMLFNNVLGSYIDPQFGLTTAGFYSQFRLTSTNVDFGQLPQFDSLVLSLAYSGYYGDTNTTQTINVYRMTESIYPDTSYYSNDEFAIDNNPVGTLTFNPKPSTKVFVANDTVGVAPHIRIKLDDSFGNAIINAGSGVLANNDTWLQFFPGLFIQTEDVMNNGAMLYINYASAQSKLTVYYDSSKTYDFVISAAAARVNVYEHDYFSLIPFGDSLQGGVETYVQSMAGVKTKINLPYLGYLSHLGPIAVNKAELIIKVINGTTDVYPPHDRLVLFAADSLGKNVVLPDQISSATSAFFGGEYNAVNKEYVFNIPRYVQQVIDDKRDNYGLYLLASAAASNANRTVIGGGSAQSQAQMKLRITYTKIQ